MEELSSSSSSSPSSSPSPFSLAFCAFASRRAFLSSFPPLPSSTSQRKAVVRRRILLNESCELVEIVQLAAPAARLATASYNPFLHGHVYLRQVAVLAENI